jgi:hypothetical protein
MDFSGEMNKPLFVVRENEQTRFVTPNDLKGDIKMRMASLYAYLAKKLEIKEVPKVVFTKDQENAKNPFGLTGYYDPKTKSIRLYITDRHDTDILRSFAHEVIHHWQNENGTLGDAESKNHYAQEDENLRKREMEAYLFGNILFRDWQDENRYGPPTTPPVLPQPIQENLTINNELKLKKGIEKLLQAFVADGTIGSYNRGLSSGKMNATDFIGDFTNKLLGALRGQIKTINDRGNWENQAMDTEYTSIVACPNCKAAFNYNEQPEVAMGAIKCPFCNTTMNQDGEAL